MKAHAVKDTATDGWVNFAQSNTPRVATLDIRCLRTKSGCRSWRRGNKYERRDQDNRYRIIEFDLTVGETKDVT